MSAVEPIAIIGIGCRLPGGVRSPDDLWKLMINGVDAITEVPPTRWHLPAMYHPDPSRPGRMYSRWGGFLDHIDQFDAQFFGITPREAAPADPQQRLLLEVAYEAVEDAGLTMPALAGRPVGVFVGISSYDYGAMQLNPTDRGTIGPYTNLGSALCIAANRISYFFNLIGPSLAVDTACSSSLVATHLACQSIWTGESELAFAAGVNAILRAEGTIGGAKASMLAPDGRCKSFDARANGYVRSEGAAVVILKPLARAMANCDHIYSVIRATAVNQDGRTDGISVPNRASQEANLRTALRLADIAPASVQYVEAHGTGTPVGDPIEAAALGAVYGQARKRDERCVIGSIKSNLGHLESASGVTGLIKTALCLKHRQIPASLHFEKPNPQIPFEELQLRVAQRMQPWPETNGEPPRAGVNSFGFGGTNGHAILEAPPAADAGAHPQPEADDSRAWLLPLSARSVSALPDLARSYLNALRDERGLKHAALRDICFSAGMRRTHHEFRLALVAHDNAEMIEQLDAFLRGEARANSSSGRPSQESSQPVFVCSGMGQQWWAMGRDLLAQQPVYRRAVEDVSDRYAKLSGWSLLEKMTADERNSQIQDTQFGQPAIFALQIGLAALWRSWGVEPAAVVGHSAGELAASCISGALSLDDAVQVAFHRSRLQQRMVGQGVMLAAGISGAEAARLVERHARAISIAAINGPKSVTLSGDASVLAEIDKALNEAGQFSRVLQVDVPFHSPKMEQFESEVLECLRDLQPRLASAPLYSTVTGTRLTGLELDASYWYRNIRQPVRFHDAMAEIIKAGHRVFLEIGAHPILRHDIAACLNENSSQGTTLCSLRRNDRERAALLGSFGRLYTLGAEIDWQKLFRTELSAIKLPRYPFQAESHWHETAESRTTRLGQSIHPLLGNRVEAPRPSWQVTLDLASLEYLQDHRIGNAIVFPGAGYVEMALAVGHEIFGPVPCVLEDMEFQKFLFLDEQASCSAQVVLDIDSSAFDIYTRADAADNSWDLHAHGCVRHAGQGAPAIVDLASLRRGEPDAIGAQEHYRLFADMGLRYGPTFRGIRQLWRGEGEALAEIEVAPGIGEHLSDYRLHPAVLDACIQSILATLPARTVWQAAQGRPYVPVKIERLYFHGTPSTRLFAYSRLKEFNPTELKADIQVVDDSGQCLVDVQGIVCRPTGNRVRRANSTIYEYQWTLQSLRTTSAVRDSHHIASFEVLNPIMQAEGDALRRRFNRARYQNEFESQSRATAVAYITHALRELGWTPALGQAVPVETLAERLKVAPQHHQLLALLLREMTADELGSTDDPQRSWKGLWDDFPEYHAEVTLFRQCGENLAAVLRDEIDPLNLIFPQGTLTIAEHLYEDSLTFRLNNLLVQKAMIEIVQRLPKGKALRVLEIGGGTGGMTSFLLPVLPEHCCEYLFTDISARFIAHAQHKFAQYPFVQCRTLDIERDPLEQGFDAYSYDLIVASDVLHATKDLRQTLERVRQLLGSYGTLVLLEMTRPWLGSHLIFGMLKGWWLFEDHDLRPDEPCLSPRQWQQLLRAAGFSDTVCVGDGPDADNAQHSVILARGPQLSASPSLAPQTPGEARDWLLFVDDGAAGRASAGAELARRLRGRGDRVIEVTPGAEFRQIDSTRFQVRVGDAKDMNRLVGEVSKQAPHLAGVVHLWSIDAGPTEAMTSDALMSSVMPSCVGVLQLIRSLALAERLVADGIWLVTRMAQPIEKRAGTLDVTQSPLWGLGKVIASEYRNLRCWLVDLTTCSDEEIASLIQELDTADDKEDEIALHGELRYVHRFVPVSPGKVHGTGRRFCTDSEPFRIELPPSGILDSLSARSIARRPPGPNEVEIEVVATGLNFRDLMKTMGLLPKDVGVDDPAGELLGVECAGRVVAVGDGVSQFSVGDEVVACGTSCLATHITGDWRHAAHKPRHLTFEQAATIPVVFSTAHYSLHTLARIQRGERVLIHSATGGVGLAAVQLAQNAEAVVFATAGSPEKRDLLARLGVPHVMDSRSLAFADEVMRLTGGEGVDVVLNSLSGEAIDKNLSILRPRGRIVEIGKIDIYKNRKIGMRPLRSNISLFCLDMNSAVQRWPDLAQSLLREVLALFESNDLHPLPHRVFPAARVADAFRHMSQAKHVGKLIVSVNDRKGLEIERDRRSLEIAPDASYLISGGLGGLGLAVADRLARHGARHLALVGRSDPSPAAQAAVDALRTRGVEVMIFRADIADREQTERVIVDIQRSMGPLRGIMHAAMVLDDAPIERLTEERMRTVMAPKIMGAWNLHSLTINTPLDFFVMFSSISAVIGNPGQANYAAGNAFLDALAYYRRAQGRPALTVDWGMVGEVGHVANSPEAAGRLGRFGLRPIPVSDTLDALDELIASNAVQVAVVEVDWKDLLRLTASRTLARFAGLLTETDGEDGRSKTSSRAREILEADEATLPSLLETYIRDHLARAMGAAPARIDVQQSLVSLGLDSLIAVEVRNRINGDLGVNVPLAKFMQGGSISALAAYLAERLLQDDGGERSKIPTRGPDAETGSAIVAEQMSETGHGQRSETPDIDAGAAAEADIAVNFKRFESGLAPLVSGPVKHVSSASPALARSAEAHEPFPLNPIQEAYWVGRTTGTLSGVAIHAYHEFESVSIDLPRFEQAWRNVVAHHEALRIVISDEGMQRVLSDVPPYVIEKIDLTSLEGTELEGHLLRHRQEVSTAVRPTDRWPLFEIRALWLPAGRIRICMDVDLTTLDAGSLRRIVLRDLLRQYQAPQDPLPPLPPCTFRDCVLAQTAWRQGEAYAKSMAYWEARRPTFEPAPQLPLVSDPVSISGHITRRRQRVLPAPDWSSLKAKAKRRGLTPSMALCAAYAEVIACWSSGQRYLLNLTHFAAPPIHPRVNEIAGDFTNLVFLEIFRQPETRFAEWAKELQSQLLSHLDHSIVHGVNVLRAWSKHRAPVTPPIVFTSLLRSLDVSWADDRINQMDLTSGWLGEPVYGMTQTPQVWLDHIVAEHRETLLITWDAVEALFPEGMLDAMLATFESRITALASSEDAWEARCPDILPPSHRALIEAANATDAPLSEQTLHGLFEAQATLRPAQAAVIEDERTLSYGELDRLANRLGRRLRKLGASPNRLVAIVMEKGWEQVAGVLGVLKSGAAYLPVDVTLPAERCGTLLRSGEVTVALTQSRVAVSFPWPEGITRVAVDEPLAEDDSPLDAVQGPGDLAYVIFTSGSTGVPKGVMIAHRGPVNYLLDLNRRYAVGSSDKVFGLSSLSFDLSVYDIFGAFAAGATLVLPSKDQQRDPAQWVPHLQRGVSIWNTVPALMQILVEYATGRPDVIASMQDLRVIQLSGDWIPVSLPEAIRAIVPDAKIVSVGGATETSINSILYEVNRVDPAWTSIPYGRPMTNQRAYVLDERLEPCPLWVPGELYVAGVGLARGYWADPVQTGERFLTHPRTGERVYRTGDWSRWLPDGNLEFLGRRDQQVKVHGHRIELGEIETTLERHPWVARAVVVAEGDKEKRLVAHVVPERPSTALDGFGLEASESATVAWPPLLQNPEARSAFQKTILTVRSDVEITTVLDGAERAALAPPTAEGIRRSPLRTEKVSHVALAGLLECTRRMRNEYTALPKARYGSAGSLYPVQLYVIVEADRVEGVESGVYYYHPIEHALIRVAGPLSFAGGSAGGGAASKQRAFTLLLVGNMAGVAPIYGPLSERFCWIEAGLVSHLLERTAREHGLGLRSAAGFPAEGLQAMLRLGQGDRFLYALAGWVILDPEDELDTSKSTLEEASSDPADLPRRTLPNASLPSLLEDPLERFKFKARLASVRHDLGPLTSLPQTFSDEEIERVWVRRRSFRTYHQEAVPRETVAGLLRSLRRFPDDTPVDLGVQYRSDGSLYPVQVYLWVRPGRVQGIEQGIYYYHPTKHALGKMVDSVEFEGRIPLVNDEMFREAAFGLFFVGKVAEIAPLCGDRAFELCWLQVGRMCQLLEEVAHEHRVGLCQVAGFKFTGLESSLALVPGDRYLHALVGGAVNWSAADRGWPFLAETVPPVTSARAPESTQYVGLLQAHCRKTLPEAMVPVAFRVHEELPLNANGKVDRAALSRQVADRLSGEGRSSGGASPKLSIARTSDELIAIVGREAAAAFNLERVHPEARFGELGVDSMMALRFRNRLERALNCSLPAEVAFNYPSVAAIARYLDPNAPGAGPTEVDGSETSTSRARLAAVPDSRRLGVLEEVVRGQIAADLSLPGHEALKSDDAVGGNRLDSVTASPRQTPAELGGSRDHALESNRTASASASNELIVSKSLHQAKAALELPRDQSALATADLLLPRAILPVGLPRRLSPVPPRHVLLTGATGFLGRELLAGLLSRCDSQITCPIRANSDEEAAHRLADVLAANGAASASWEIGRRVHAVAGQLSEPDLGLGEKRYAALASQLDSIVHSAAEMSFVYDYARLRSTNVVGTRHILHLAARSGAIPLHYVSSITVFDSDEYRNVERAFEDELPELASGFVQGYALSKWVAERNLRIARARGQPVTIYRPGLITGDSVSGRYPSGDLFTHFLRLAVLLEVVPDRALAIDLTPVDFVASAISELVANGDGVNATLHLVGPRRIAGREIAGWMRASGYRLDEADPADWRSRVDDFIERSPEDPAAIFGGLLRNRAVGMTSFPEFDTSQAEHLLAPHGIVCSVVDAPLFLRYVNFLRDAGFLDYPPTPDVRHGGRPDESNLCRTSPSA
jgi:amino acid adenylation domain-containing protein/thioester reductase-like protein